MTGSDSPARAREDLVWHDVADADALPEGRVTTVTAGTKTVALTRFEGVVSALDNRCPHQGGPLGEGSIENGWLRCPWHGWDFHPCTGRPPGGYDDGVPTFPVEERDGRIRVGLPAERPHVRTVTDVMAETLVEWGVDTVFGMVGHSNLGLADALRRQEAQGRLRYYGVRHEGAASFACSAYAKLTGRPAACLSIAGPGATNLLTGLWDAKVDRAPVIALTGQVDTQVLGPGAFQEVDLSSAFEAVSAWSQTVLPGSRHAELVNLACKHAILERDVAHLIFPDEVQTLPAAEGAKAGGPAGRVTPPGIRPPVEALDAAIAKLRAAERPLVVLGHGARFRAGPVLELAEKLRCPVITTFKGKGVIPDSHPLAGGVLGRSGTPIASWLMNECDLMLVFGASFSNHTGITPKKFLIQVDLDPMALGKFHAVDIPVWGEIGETARALLAAADGARSIDHTAEVAERWRIWREEKSRRALDDRGRGVSSAAVFAAMNRRVPEDAVIAVDVGNNTYSFGRYFESRPGQAVLMSGYLGSIGFGYPAAMGAWAATRGQRPVLAVTGDGGFGQYLAELTTAVKYGMRIVHVLLNNGELGKISKEQRAGEWEVWQTSLHNPDFSEYARLCGAHGARVERTADLDDALVEALDREGPSLVEVHTDAELV